MKHRHANKRWKAGMNETQDVQAQASEQEVEMPHVSAAAACG